MVKYSEVTEASCVPLMKEFIWSPLQGSKNGQNPNETIGKEIYFFPPEFKVCRTIMILTLLITGGKGKENYFLPCISK